MTDSFSMSQRRDFANVHSSEALLNVNNEVAVVKEKKGKMVSRSENPRECLMKLFTRWLLHYSLDSQPTSPTLL